MGSGVLEFLLGLEQLPNPVKTCADVYSVLPNYSGDSLAYADILAFTFILFNQWSDNSMSRIVRKLKVYRTS